MPVSDASLLSSEQRGRMSTNARDCFLKRYDLEQNAMDLLRLIESQNMNCG